MPGYYDRMPYDRPGQDAYRTSGNLNRDGFGYDSTTNGNRFRGTGTEGYAGTAGTYGTMGAGGYQNRAAYPTGTGFNTGQGYGTSHGYSAGQGTAQTQGTGYFSGSSSLAGSSSYGGFGTRYDTASSSYSTGSSSYDTSSGPGAAGYSGASGVNPLQGSMSGAVPGVGGGGRNSQEGMLPTPRGSDMGSYTQGGAGRSGNVDIVGAVSQLQQMGNAESKLALNILSAVLGKSDESTGGEWSGAPPSKMRRMDWDEGHGMRRGQAVSSAMQPQPMRRYPQRDEYQPHRVWDSEPPQLAMASRPLSSGGPPKMGFDHNRRMARGRRGGRNTKSPAKDQSRGRREATGGDRSSGGQRKMSEGGSSAASGSRQSGGSGADRSRSSGSAPRTPHQDIPREALICHMCNLTGFNAVGGYIAHLQTREHIDSATAYHNQSAATLQLLRSEAKLAARRSFVKNKKKEQSMMFFCSKCQCRVPGTLNDHYKSIEHILVNQFLKVKCCGKLFSVRGELEMHRLGLDHLKYQYNLKKEREEESKTKEPEEEAQGVTEEEALEIFKNAAEEHNARNKEEVFTVDTLPSYDPSQPVGLHLLGIRSHYRCKMCPNKTRLETEHQVLKHFRSIDHYQNLYEAIVAQQIEKRKRKMEKTMEKATELINKSKEEGKPKEGEEEKGKNAASDTNEKSKEDANTSKEEADTSKEDANISKDDADRPNEEEEADLEAIGEDIAVDIGEDIELTEDPAEEQEEEHCSDAEATENAAKDEEEDREDGAEEEEEGAEEEEETMETEEHGDEKEDGDADNQEEMRDQDEELCYDEEGGEDEEQEKEEDQEGHEEQEVEDNEDEEEET